MPQCLSIEDAMDVKPILSVCLSSADIFGAMLSAGKRVDYHLRIPGSTADDGIFSFQYVGDEILAINNLDVPVQLSFPATQCCPGKAVTILSKQNAVITTEVIGRSNAFVKDFEITVGTAINGFPALEEGDKETVFRASGEVLREIKGAVKLCDEISVDMIDRDLYICSHSPYILKGVNLLEITFNNRNRGIKLVNLDQAAFPPPSVINKSALYLKDILPDTCSDINVSLSAYCSAMSRPASKNPIKKEQI